MRFGRASAKEEIRASIESPTVPVSAENFFEFFGMQKGNLPRVTIESALTVPAVLAAVSFLSRTLASLPRHAYRRTDNGAEKLKGKLQALVHDAPNAQMGAFKFWQYFWQQVFTGGRGLAWIERSGGTVVNLWLMEPSRTQITRKSGVVTYKWENQEYPAEDVIDIPFMLRSNQTGHYSPVVLAGKAIQLSIAMNDYAATFFAGGGIPPLAMTGPLPTGADGLKRAMADVHRVIEEAKRSGRPVFAMPPGYKLDPVGFDPAKGQMTDARRFQIEETARVYQMPPVFLQDLSRATFNNSEQQDLHLVKHLIGQWTQALEDEMNLKVFGRDNRNRYIEHNLDGLQRGDFKSRVDGYARAIQTAQMTPDEVREKENRPKHTNPAASELLVQGATVVLGTAVVPKSGAPDGGTEGSGAGEDKNASQN